MGVITTVEAHAVILLACAANLVTTVLGLRSLRRRLNGHLAPGAHHEDGHGTEGM